jgi:hypothetical protein
MLEGGGLSFLDEGGGVLKIKVLRLGAALKKFNICYLSPTASPPPPPPPPPPLLMAGPLEIFIKLHCFLQINYLTS